ncbi:MAG: hypothetical protein IJO52_10105 [Clostridia bacterium]|nr:hypothetical protein [Clostridia bacterium]
MIIKNKLEGWKLAVMAHDDVTEKAFDPKTSREILMSGCKLINATVPGNIELELMKDGTIPEDIYFGENILKAQDVEDMHMWYFTEFEYEDNGKDGFLLFEGIDTAADIYIDGEHFAFTENMLIAHEFSLGNIAYGKHEVVVHITPASVYVRDIPYEAQNYSLSKYNADSILIRKAPYMYGWDIMPRTVSAGLWKDVSVVYKNKNRIEEYCFSIRQCEENSYALIRFKNRIHTNVGNLRRFSMKIEGKCGESEFSYETGCFGVNSLTHVNISNPKLWWPKNYGEANLYRVKITLYLDGNECDSVEYNMGIRAVELVRTSSAGKDGKFEFIVNGKRVFALGTNWVPTDAFPSRHAKYNMRGLELANDIGCNMIRCWGGNAYPDDAFFDYCDKNGIMVWQDFTMGCAKYPQDERFRSLMLKEAEYIVRSLRNHASIVLWSGDNECDSCNGGQITFNGKEYNVFNPNDNVITRAVIPDVIRRLDGTRPYLPSSPYYDEEAFVTQNPSEQHLWGPRDYFKGDYYYKHSVCHFASETGYHGCPSPSTLRKIISEDSLSDRGDSKKCTNRQWLAHATCVEPVPENNYSYRIPLMTRQVERLFGTADEDIVKYALKSQISQAEAMKFFIEHFRAGKWYRTGIIWWNIIDGWAQISDAVVDWYGTKKLAYHYIKCSQTPFCLICDEPDENGVIHLVAANDTRKDVNISYTVTDALTGEKITCGNAMSASDTATVIDGFREEKRYYLISWSGDENGTNHFKGKIGDGVDFDEYTEFMKKTGYYEKLEGFEA